MSAESQLIRTEMKMLGWRYVSFIILMGLSGLAGLVPPKLAIFLTEGLTGIHNLSEVSARSFIESFALFSLAVAMLMFFTDFVRAIAEEWICLKVEGNLRMRALRAIHDLPVEKIDEARRGEWMTRLGADLSSVESFLTRTIPEHVVSFVTLVGITVLFALEKPEVAFAIIASALVLGGFNLWLQTKMEPILDKLRSLHGEIFQGLLESLESFKIIRSTGKKVFLEQRFAAKIRSVASSGLRVAKIMGLLRGSTGVLTQVITALFLIIASWSVYRTELTVGEALLFPFYIGLLYSHSLELMGAIFDWKLFKIEGGRLSQILETSRDGASTEIDAIGFQELEVDNLSWGYQQMALNDKPLNLTIARGKTLLIEGPSGSGKSTLLEVLTGLRSAISGSWCLVRMDGSQSAGAYRFPTNLCAYTEQSPYLFEMSLAENIALEPDYKDYEDKIKGILARIGLDNLVSDASSVSDFQIRERGLNLSQGQAFRVGLARALYQERKILVLDEPFAALDPITTATIVSTLNKIRKEKSMAIILVSHSCPVHLDVDDTLTLDPEVGDSAPLSNCEFTHENGFVGDEFEDFPHDKSRF